MVTAVEAQKIAKRIQPIFQQYYDRYDIEKYPQVSYESYKLAYASRSPTNKEIHNSLVWKWGHVGKDNFPAKQLKLIQLVKGLWPTYVTEKACSSAEDSFNWWREKLPLTSYITTAFITHLIHHSEDIPIIDQHNFRAMNFLMAEVRRRHLVKKKPSNWQDIANLRLFFNAILLHLYGRSRGDLDRFLMMYGRSLKPRKNAAVDVAG